MNYNQDKLAEYYETKKEWENIQSERSEGIIMEIQSSVGRTR